jgi:hypothetical protein
MAETFESETGCIKIEISEDLFSAYLTINSKEGFFYCFLVLEIYIALSLDGRPDPIYCSGVKETGAAINTTMELVCCWE